MSRALAHPRPVLLAADEEPNRFFSGLDLEDERYLALHEAMEAIRAREIDVGGRDRPPGRWRWTLPWMVLNGELRAGLRVADFAAGGSPLPAYLARERLCRCTGLGFALTRPHAGEGRAGVGGMGAGASFAVDPGQLFPQVEWRPLRAGEGGSVSSGLEDSSQDRVLWGGLSPGEEMARAELREAARVLRPGGLMLVTVALARDGRGGEGGGGEGGRGGRALRGPMVIALAGREGLAVEGECDWIAPELPPIASMDLLGLVLRKS